MIQCIKKVSYKEGQKFKINFVLNNSAAYNISFWEPTHPSTSDSTRLPSPDDTSYGVPHSSTASSAGGSSARILHELHWINSNNRFSQKGGGGGWGPGQPQLTGPTTHIRNVS